MKKRLLSVTICAILAFTLIIPVVQASAAQTLDNMSRDVVVLPDGSYIITEIHEEPSSTFRASSEKTKNGSKTYVLILQQVISCTPLRCTAPLHTMVPPHLRRVRPIHIPWTLHYGVSLVVTPPVPERPQELLAPSSLYCSPKHKLFL